MKWTHRSLSIAFVAIFGVLSTIAGVLVHAQFQDKRERHEQRLQGELQAAYHALESSYFELARLAFDSYVMRRTVLDILVRANSDVPEERNAARQALLEALTPVYEVLVRGGVRQFHFHLPNCDSLLRFHRPALFGDNLRGVHISVEKANDERVLVRGFEEGRVFNGFRNVFPIEYRGRHLGSVEISTNFEAVRRGLDRIFPHRYSFIIRSDVVKQKVFAREQGNYKPSGLSPDYLLENLGEVSEELRELHGQIEGDLAAALRAGKPYVTEFRADGRVQLAVFAPIHNIQGQQVAYIVSFNIDDTIASYRAESWFVLLGSIAALAALALLLYSLVKGNRRLSEEKQRVEQSEARYRQIFETNQAIKLIIDPRDGRIVEANDAASRFYGYTREELLSLSIDDLNTLSQEEVSSRMSEAFAAQRLYFEFQHRLKSGQVRDVEVYSGPVGEGDERLLYSIVHDVTARNEAQRKVQQLSRAVEQSVNTIVVTSLEGDIEFANPAFTSTTGYEIDEAIGQNPRFLGSGSTPDVVYDELWKTITAGKVWTGEFINRKKNGDTYYEEAVISPLRDDTGTITHYLAVKEDVTERRQLEQQLVQQERLAAVGQLSAGIAHDFNNILTSILGFAELLELSPELPGSLASSVARIRDSSEQAAHLVRQLLDFSRKSVRRTTRVSLRDVVADSISLLEHSVTPRITLTAELPDEDAWIDADLVQLQQLLLNLTVNSRDAIQDQGEVRIRVSREFVRQQVACDVCSQPLSGEWLVLEVQDNGDGIPSNVLPHVFEPFFTTKDVGKGTGLGLAQVSGIVKQHDGHIAVQSAPGQGTTMRIYLPPGDTHATPSNEKQGEVHELDFRGGAGETILLVEDEPGVRDTIQILLTRMGYRVLTAASARLALELFERESEHIGVVLSDMRMPDMDGEELFAELKRRHEHLRMIIMSGYPLGNDGSKLLERGLVAWVQKPISASQLSQVIRSSLSGR
jgi:PAS domain S-box-containing protein